MSYPNGSPRGEGRERLGDKREDISVYNVAYATRYSYDKSEQRVKKETKGQSCRRGD